MKKRIVEALMLIFAVVYALIIFFVFPSVPIFPVIIGQIIILAIAFIGMEFLLEY